MEYNPEKLKELFNEIIDAEERKEEYAAHVKAIYAKLKSDGHDCDAMKKIVADRKKDMKRVFELEDMVNVYRDALGISKE